MRAWSESFSGEGAAGVFASFVSTAFLFVSSSGAERVDEGTPKIVNVTRRRGIRQSEIRETGIHVLEAEVKIFMTLLHMRVVAQPRLRRRMKRKEK